MTKLLAHVCLLVQFMLFFVAFYICQLSHRLCYCFCSALKEEKIAARTALVPVLQAEEDERYSSTIDAILYIFPTTSSVSSYA